MGSRNSQYRAWEESRMQHAWKAYWESVALSVGGGTLFRWLIRCGAVQYTEKITQLSFSLSWIPFTVIWEILYLLMGISAARIYLKADSEMRIYALKTYCWQLLFNWTWGVWIFNLQWYGFAFLWLLALSVQVIWMIAAFRELDILAARLQIPYLICLLLIVCIFAVEALR